MVRVKSKQSASRPQSRSQSPGTVRIVASSPTVPSFHSPTALTASYVWLPSGETKDAHAAFRLSFSTTEPNASITLKHVGVTWYNLWLDEKPLAEGPTRFQGTPMYDQVTITVATPGMHVVAAHVHSAGVQTRLQLLSSPALYCEISGDCTVSKYTCLALDSYRPQWQRLSSLLGWCENCTVDTQLLSWKKVSFDDSKWLTPVAVSSYATPVPLSALAAPAASIEGSLVLMGWGSLVERYGYVDDAPAARFALRSLTSADEKSAAGALDYGPPQGRWWRFDASYCRLLRPVFKVRAKPGTVFEICYCQALIDGKASPFHPLCGSTSCYIDRYAIGSDISATQDVVLCPLEPRGARYIELHALCDDRVEDLSFVQLVSANVLFRGYQPYLAPPTGDFSSVDTQLVTIWKTGVVSTSACVEDTCIDGPCRERGQWTGDTLAVSLPNVAAAFDDISPIRLCLFQTSASADENGVVSGNCPNNIYITDYALIWVEGAAKYLSASGDTANCNVLKSRAARQLDYYLSSECYSPSVGFIPPDNYGNVIDWGYTDNQAFAPLNMCINALLVSALAAMVRLCLGVGDSVLAQKYDKARTDLSGLLKQALGVDEKESEEDGWVHMAPFDPSKLGFHAAALCLRAGLLDSHQAATVAFIKSTLTSMFPINPNAPRLSDPDKRSPTGFYTPYFQTFTFEALFRAGEADFVLGQYRQAWGWALTQSSTWLEVFDPRWEAVHSWGGCPTWQLSQFLLGLVPRFDVGPRYFDFDLKPGTLLTQCSGTVPTRDATKRLAVVWQRTTTTSVQFKLIVVGADVFVKGWPTSPSTYFKLTPGNYAVTVQV